MSVFSYNGSALSNLVGNTPGANVSNLVTLLNDIKTFLNGTNLDYTNLATSVDSYYKNLRDAWGTSGGASTAGTYVFANGVIALQAAAGSALGAFYLDPADFTAGTRSPMLRIRATTLVNANSPGINYTYSLFPVTAAGGSGASQVSLTLGAAVASSGVTITSPVNNTLSHGETSDFACPVAGFYALGIALSGTEAAPSGISHRVALQFRAV